MNEGKSEIKNLSKRCGHSRIPAATQDCVRRRVRVGDIAPYEIINLFGSRSLELRCLCLQCQPTQPLNHADVISQWNGSILAI